MIENQSNTCPILDANLAIIKDTIVRCDMDYVLVISGDERAGKSNLGTYCALQVMPTFTKANFHYGHSTFIEGTVNSKPGDAYVIDEGGEALFSRDWQNKGQKDLIKSLMVVGYKNLFIVVIIPDFSNLDRYIRTHRVNSLLVAEKYYDPGRKEIVRGLFKCYGRKKIRKIKTYRGSDAVKYPRPDFFEWCPDLRNTPYSSVWNDYKTNEPGRKDEALKEHGKDADEDWKAKKARRIAFDNRP